LTTKREYIAQWCCCSLLPLFMTTEAPRSVDSIVESLSRVVLTCHLQKVIFVLLTCIAENYHTDIFLTGNSMKDIIK